MVWFLHTISISTNPKLSLPMEINYLKAGFILTISVCYILFNTKIIQNIPRKIKKLF